MCASLAFNSPFVTNTFPNFLNPWAGSKKKEVERARNEPKKVDRKETKDEFVIVQSGLEEEEEDDDDDDDDDDEEFEEAVKEAGEEAKDKAGAEDSDSDESSESEEVVDDLGLGGAEL